ncbi:MAG TPA: ATP-binding protein [Gemmatimonadaceae bacterium]|nr:ATP-binding protein [Gemmatimonadaceae bacterium]
MARSHRAPPRRVVVWVLSLIALAAVTVGMAAIRGHLTTAHVALTFLLVVLLGSAAGGRTLGLLLAVLAFVLFNYVFLPPYYTVAIEDPFDWIVLAAFLVTSIVATHLLNRAQQRAEEARQRAIEVERLAVLGAETLNVGRAEDALAAIANVIRTTLGVEHCDISLDRAGPTPAASDASIMNVPLQVRARTVGVLRIAHSAPIALDPAQRRFLDVLAYYAALGVERVRLVAEAERAEALRQADALRNALIAGVSHDVRTPLTTIKAIAHRLASHGSPDAASIEEEADRLDRFVGDLLDLSRLNAGDMSMHLELNTADDLVGAVVHHVRELPGAQALCVRHDQSGAVLFGTFDIVQSMRVLANLVENALKYGPPVTPVELFVERCGGRLRFGVADRGPGIPPGEQDRIFEPFYRPPGARPDVGGAGLGLAIARRLAEAQHGAVRYEPRPGGGSIFLFELPAAATPVAPAAFTRF